LICSGHFGSFVTSRGNTGRGRANNVIPVFPEPNVIYAMKTNIPIVV